MMIVYLRLLEGLTSFILKRCESHRSSIGPAGVLESRLAVWKSAVRRPVSVCGLTVVSVTINLKSPFLPNHASENSDRYRNITDHNHASYHCCERMKTTGSAGRVDA